MRDRDIETELKEAAVADALNGQPVTNSQQLTGAENKALAFARKEGQERIRQIEAHLQQTRNAVDSAKDDCSAARRERQTILDRVPPTPQDLNRLKEERDLAIAAFNNFRQSNHLDRPAAGDDRVTQALWATAIVAVEGLINSYFYAPVSDLGLVGGFFTAFFVSFVNVGFAFIGGVLGLRYLSHVDTTKQLGGVVAFLLCLAVCALVVAFSALFRGHIDSLRTSNEGIEDIEVEAWNRAVQSILEFDMAAMFLSLDSFLLLFVGVFCAILGFWKGWEFDDPYPGYGGRYRKRAQMINEYEDARIENDSQQRKFQKQRNADLQNISMTLETKISTMRACADGANKSLKDANKLGNQTRDRAHHLLQVYRKENAAVRAAEPPTYFDSFPAAEDFEDLDDEVNQQQSDLLMLGKRVNENIAACSAERSKLGNAQRAIGR